MLSTTPLHGTVRWAQRLVEGAPWECFCVACNQSVDCDAGVSDDDDHIGCTVTKETPS